MSEGNGMMLTEAIEIVRRNVEPDGYDVRDFDAFRDASATAIATILNAVVKGELK